jgi:hypothetical protein
MYAITINELFAMIPGNEIFKERMKDLLENCKGMSLRDIDTYFYKKYHDIDAHERSKYLNQFSNGAQNIG